MSVLWRIAQETPTYTARDLGGAGARITGGRWNSKGVPVVYCSTSIALAILETVHGLCSGTLPFNRYLVRIDIPDALWATRQILDLPPGGWDAIPAGMSSRAAGNGWIAARKSALLMVPSVIVPGEYNVLLNPRHADAGAIAASTVKRWIYDPRFFP